jgi:hypothetical protein
MQTKTAKPRARVVSTFLIQGARFDVVETDARQFHDLRDNTYTVNKTTATGFQVLDGENETESGAFLAILFHLQEESSRPKKRYYC